MNFSENLKKLRNENNLSQENLAEILNVTRQAISKWESSNNYPELETLLLISKTFNITLDSLLNNEINNNSYKIKTFTGRILIYSFDENNIINCYKVLSSSRFRTKDDEPKYALFGVDSTGFWGDNTTLLGWYDKEENLKKEINEIMKAMENGNNSYKIKYAVKVSQHFLKVNKV